MKHLSNNRESDAEIVLRTWPNLVKGLPVPKEMLADGWVGIYEPEEIGQNGIEVAK